VIDTAEFDTHGAESVSSKMISFRNYKGFKKVDDVRKLYKMGKELGSGSFGSVF